MSSDHTDARAAAIRAEAEEILARTAPTPESIAEDEERRRHNRMVEIMGRTDTAATRVQAHIKQVLEYRAAKEAAAARPVSAHPVTRAYVDRRVQAAFDAICSRLVPLIVKDLKDQRDREHTALEASEKPRVRVKALGVRA